MKKEEVFSSGPEAAHIFFFFVYVQTQMCTYTHPHRNLVCVCFLLPPPCLCSLCLLYPLPPPSPPLSVAAVLVMAVRPWCKLAVGSQVALMTVIDVQVFSSPHTGTLEPHTRVHKHTHMSTHRYIVDQKKKKKE